MGVPEGAYAGATVNFTTEEGDVFQAVVPEGLTANQNFQCNVG